MFSLRTPALAAAALLVASAGLAAEIDDIHKAIKARGARWHAEENAISRLPRAEKIKRLGLLDDGPAAAAASADSSVPLAALSAAPATFDWRSMDDATATVSYVSPVKNQGSCGSCWAFAVTAALESQKMIGTAGAPADLSEQVLLSCSGAGTCSGGYVSTASAYVVSTGSPAESLFPYTAANTACSSAAPGWQTSADKANGWHSVPATVDALKSALFAYGPVVASFNVYSDFPSYAGGVYSYTTGSYLGGHAVLVVGYDDVAQAFLVKNSWGSGWGEAGYFRVAYSQVGGTIQFGRNLLAYDGWAGLPPPPDTTAPSAAVTSPAPSATLSGTVTVSVSASDDKAVASVALYLDGALVSTDTTAPYSFTWNTTAAPNGAHALHAVATDDAGNQGASAALAVTVSNVADTTPPSVRIASPTSTTRLAKTTKISVSAADDVKMQKIETYVDGKLLGTVSCTAASCSGSVTWNTSKVSSGAHTIQTRALDAANNATATSVTVTK